MQLGDLTRTVKSAWRRDWWLYLPFLFAGLYAVLVALNLGPLLGWIYHDSDNASAPVIAGLLGDAPPDRSVQLGNYAWYEPLWYMLATQDLPFRRELWEGSPVLWYLGATLALAWTSWRLVGAWAAGVVVAGMVCLGLRGLDVMLAMNSHGHSVVHVVVLGVALVWFVRRAERVRIWHVAVGALALGLVTAPGVASDRLLVIAGIAPFVAAGLVSAFLFARRERVMTASFVVGAAALSLILGEVLKEAAVDARIEPHPFDLRVIPSDLLAERVEAYLTALPAFAALPYGAEVDVDVTLRVASVLLVLLALAFVAVESPRFIRAQVARAAGLQTHVLYWVLVLAATSVAYVAIQLDAHITSVRYLGPAYVAIVALLAGLTAWSAARRTAVVLGVTIFSAISFYGLAKDPAPDVGSPTYVDTNALKDWAEARGASVGYAGYWTSASITWQTDLELQLYPLVNCGTPAGLYCPHSIHRISTWYEPRPDARSIFVADALRADTEPVNEPDLERWGEPIETATFGSLSAFLYEQDIAAGLGP